MYMYPRFLAIVVIVVFAEHPSRRKYFPPPSIHEKFVQNVHLESATSQKLIGNVNPFCSLEFKLAKRSHETTSKCV
jgi:hypothetical protein